MKSVLGNSQMIFTMILIELCHLAQTVKDKFLNCKAQVRQSRIYDGQSDTQFFSQALKFFTASYQFHQYYILVLSPPLRCPTDLTRQHVNTAFVLHWTQ